jgi:potassium-transporting ATPase KdpC subunit
VRTTVIALRMLLVTAVLLGLLYPLLMTGAAQVLFPDKADGSLVRVNGKVVGSSLIAQGFTAARYFHPRPSAAGTGYDGMSSSFSNLGPTNKDLRDRVRAGVVAATEADPGLKSGEVPIDMVTTSASGLDPDITIANARVQAPRVAGARNVPLSRILQLIDAHTTGRQLGFLGEPRINVLELNLALDQLAGAPGAGSR